MSRRDSNQFIERGMKATYDWIVDSLELQGGIILMVLGVLFFGILFRSAWKIKT